MSSPNLAKSDTDPIFVGIILAIAATAIFMPSIIMFQIFVPCSIAFFDISDASASFCRVYVMLLQLQQSIYPQLIDLLL